MRLNYNLPNSRIFRRRGSRASSSVSFTHFSIPPLMCMCHGTAMFLCNKRIDICKSEKKKLSRTHQILIRDFQPLKFWKKIKFVVLKHYGILFCHSKQGNSCFYYVHFHTHFDRNFPILLRNQYEVHIYIANQNTYEYKSYSCGSVDVTSSPIKKQKAEVFLE